MPVKPGQKMGPWGTWDEHGRVCRKCEEYKPWEEYHANKRTPHGKATQCKACIREKSKQYWYTKRTHHKGDLYVMLCGPYFKVGRSVDPERRRREMEVHNPHPVVLHRVLKNSAHLEGELLEFMHQEAEHHRGEWFKRREL
jgi:hypothetical protein